MFRIRCWLVLLFILKSLLLYGQIIPKDINGLSFWLRADSSVILNGNNVVEWKDISGNGYSAVQASDPSQPVLTDGGSSISGRKVVSFDGINDFMSIPSLPFGSDFTIIVVSKQNGTAGYQHLVEPAGGGAFQLCYLDNAFKWLTAFNSDVFNTQQYHIVLTGRQNSIGKISINNKADFTGNVNSGTGTGWFIGTYNGVPTEYLNGEVAEIIIYNQYLSAVEIDSLMKYLTSRYTSLNLGPDITINKGFCDTTINAGSGYTSYLWSDGSTGPTLKVNKSGKYWVKVTDIFGFVSSDTIEVNYPLSRIPDQVICKGSSYIWNTGLSKSVYNFLWSNNTTDSILTITQAGKYAVKITDDQGCSSLSDTLTVQVDNFVDLVSLGNDTSLCKGNTISLKKGANLAVSYLWSDNSSAASIPVYSDGTYWVRVESVTHCVKQDTIVISLKGEAPKTGFDYSLACEGSLMSFIDTSKGVGGDAIQSWNWSFGDGGISSNQNPQYTYVTSGDYPVNLSVTSLSGCGSNITKTIKVNSKPAVSFKWSNTCAGGLTTFESASNDASGIKSYLWNFGDISSGSSNTGNGAVAYHGYLTSNTYQVKHIVENNYNCKDSVTTAVLITPSGLSKVPELITPNKNAEISDYKVAFSWQALQCVLSYHIQVSTTADFSSLLTDITDVKGTNYVLKFPASSKLYYWRVRGYNGISYTSWSESRRLSIIQPLLSGLSMWLRADTGLVINGSGISSWSDLSGNNNSAFAAQNINQPQYVPSDASINSKSSVRFDGISNFLNVPSADFNSDFTVIAVARQSTTTSYQHLIEPKDPGIQLAYLDNKFQWLGKVSSSAYPTTQFHIVTVSRKGAAGNIYINGILSGNGSVNTTTGKGWVIGSYNSASSEFLNGDIAEILLYNKELNISTFDSVNSYLKSRYAPPLNLGPDINVVKGFCDTTLNAGEGFKSYIWSTGEVSPSIKVNRSGTYWVKVTDIFGFESSDTILVTYPLQKVADQVICKGASFKWNTGLNKSIYTFQWNDNSTDSVLTITQAGKYAVKVTDSNGCFAISDTIKVTVDNYTDIATLGNDKALCTGNTLGLTQGAAITKSYLWSDNSTDTVIVVNSAGAYTVEVTSANGCVKKDTIFITIKGKAPVADFAYTNTCFKDTVVFTDKSVAPAGNTIVSYSWSLGDLTNSASGIVKHHYLKDTIYEVQMKVTTNVGCTGSISKKIEIYPLPEPFFNIPSICTGNEISFNSLSTIKSGNIAFADWVFSNASVAQEQGDNVKVTFNNSGTFPVKLIITSGQMCKDSLQQMVTVKQSPTVDFSYPLNCFGDYMILKDNSQTTFPSTLIEWLWSFGDGTPVSNQDEPKHLYGSPGKYKVGLQVKASNGCFNSTEKEVIVNPRPKVEFSSGPFCQNTPVQLNNTSTISEGSVSEYKWTFSGLNKTEILKNPIINYKDTGDYTIKLWAKSLIGCSDSIIQPVVVHSLPKAFFTFSPTFGIAPLDVSLNNSSTGAVSYLWDLGDGANSSLKSPKHLYKENGTYKICLNVVNDYGCSSVLCKSIKIIPAVLDLSVKDIKSERVGNALKLSTTISNLGTRDIYNFNLRGEVDGNAIIEMIKDTLLSGESKFYSFKSAFIINPNISSSFYCVRTDEPNGGKDDVVENDEQCNSLLNEFEIINVYPNPGKDIVQVKFILPEKENISAFLYDDNGNKLIDISDLASGKGLNILNLELTNFRNGLYAFKIVYRDKVLVKKIVKN